MRELLTMLRTIAVAMLIAVFGMAAWEWGEPVQALTYGCFSGPSWLEVQLREFQLHAKAIAVGSGVLLAAEFALQLLINFRDARTDKARGS